MKQWISLLLTFSLVACSDIRTKEATEEPERPRDINEAITDSTRIINDSVIVPDTGNRGQDPSRTDTSGKKMD